MDDLKQIKGLAELHNFFDDFPTKFERNVMPSALRQGAGVFEQEAKLNLTSNDSIKTMKLEGSLHISTKVEQDIVTATLQIDGKQAHIAHLLEFTGASPHQIKGKNRLAIAFAGGVYKKIEHPGFKPKPFMRPAFDAKSGAAVAAIGNVVKSRLTKDGINKADVEVEKI